MGIDYTRRPQQEPTPPAQAPAAPIPPQAYPPPQGQPLQGQPQQGGGVSLSKVTLTKSAPTVSLTKHGGQRGVMRINLNWNARPPAKGGLFRKNTQLDLDLGCLYEFSDGSKGVVQALGNSFRAGPRGGADVIVLDGDDRSGMN
ncbi:MAG: tellurium resistance protein, partial [Actinomycetota bacterium]|nr:tellurium resistance protein [Actinomycetota bacterium]